MLQLEKELEPPPGNPYPCQHMLMCVLPQGEDLLDELERKSSAESVRPSKRRTRG